MATAVTGPVRELLRAVSWHRRLLAAGLAAATVATGLTALSPAAPATVRVLAAARDLPGGHLLARTDLVTVALPRALVPSEAVRVVEAAIGHIVGAPMRRGEPLTDVRMLGPSLLAAADSEAAVAVPVRVVDGAAAALLRAGDVVDVLAAADPGAGAAGGAVASHVTVLTVRLPPSESADTGALVVVAADDATAAALANAAGSRLTLALRNRS